MDEDRTPDDVQPGTHADLPPLPFGVVVPDDASALAADRDAWLRELSDLQQRREAPAGGPASGRGPLSRLAGAPGTGGLRFGVFGAVLALVLAGAAAAGSLLLVLVPRTGLRTATPLPLATTAAVRAARPGEAGALLPDTRVRPVGGPTTSLREVRPAVLAVVGPQVTASCRDCRRLLDDVALQAAQAGLRLWLVGPSEQVPALVGLARSVGNGGSGVLEDVDGALAGALGAAGTTLVLVHADGVVAAVQRDAAEPLALAPDLTSLRAAGATSLRAAGAGPVLTSDVSGAPSSAAGSPSSAAR